jgi:hypothetical protein
LKDSNYTKQITVLEIEILINKVNNQKL